MSSPTVVSVSSKPTPGVHKIRRDEVRLIANHGVEGDYHAGEFVRHRSRAAKDRTQPNLRQVHLMHAELFEELAPLGIHVEPGMMGENITTHGLAILDLAPGTRLRLGASAVIEITGCRNPCAQLNGVDPRLLAEVAQKQADGGILRKAGIMATVIKGGLVHPGDGMCMEAPAHDTLERLRPV